jgi:hypothetical protein
MLVPILRGDRGFGEVAISPQFRGTQSSVTTSLTSMLPRVAFE